MMVKNTPLMMGALLLGSATMTAPISVLAADDLISALSGGKSKVDMRLRYETVDQDNNLDDASALTLRTRLMYTTDAYNGVTATVEFEDSRVVLGEYDFNAAGLGGDTDYSVIADPEVTEVDQAFLKYKTGGLTLKLGRQVMTRDNHRFVGHVGWRQDRQTFDALSADYAFSDDLSVSYAYIGQRNRIFAEARDIDAKDHLLNASYKTPFGKLVGYAYLLEVDDDTDNGLDTYGIRFSGKTGDDIKFLYAAEFATQEVDSGGSDPEADYMMLEGGIVVSGITAKLSYEVLGSDDGNYGFTTPLATLHKFNGWADQFIVPGTPSEGLVDISLSLSGKLAGGKWAVIYHDYESDDSGASDIDDFGDELNLLYAKKFGKNYSAGIKYAAYAAGDAAANKVDTDKLWIWGGLTF